MALVITATPGAEPIALAEAKAHLRIDADDEDALVEALIAAARMHVERALGLALVTQTWSYLLDFWPRGGCITLPVLPVQAVASVKLHDAAGSSATNDTDAYDVDALSQPARLVLKGALPASLPRALNAYEVSFTAGYGDEATAGSNASVRSASCDERNDQGSSRAPESVRRSARRAGCEGGLAQAG